LQWTLALQLATVLRTLLGGFYGRVVKIGGLAEELGLPWQLLQRLFQQHIGYRVAAVASSVTEQARQDLQEKMTDAATWTVGWAQSTAATAKQQQTDATAALQHEVHVLQLAQQQAGGYAAAAGAAAADDVANNAAAAPQLDPQQQLVNQQNAQLQQQNQMNAQADAALQQADGQPEPEVLPTEDYNSVTAVLRQLQARLDAGERSIPVPKQAQLGPLPLWQQCLLELVASHMESLGDSVDDNGLYAYLTSGMLVADSEAAAAADAEAAAGEITPLQRLLGSGAFVSGPPVSPQPGRLPWGRLLAQAAVELRQPQLLAWALLQQQQQRLWGSAHNAAKAAVWDLTSKQICTPISNAVSRHPQQQRADMQQLQISRQQQLPGWPVFARLVAETAMLLLNITPNNEGLLSDWLQHGLHPSSSEAELVRAKAVLAAVVDAEQLLAGAQLMRRNCLKEVQRTGDVDLLALVVLWGHRVPDEPEGN
jgi:hypothetical protein